MLSASLRKSVTDLSRRRARTVFSVLTLALAVASISFFAVPTLIDRAMQGEVRSGRLADVTVALRPVKLTNEQLAALAALPNVEAVEARSSVDVRVLIGERRAPARVIGVRNFARQRVDVVRVESGAFPGRRELLADVQDANVGVYAGRAGDTLTVVGAAGERANVRRQRARPQPSGWRAGAGRERDRPLRAVGHGGGAERGGGIRESGAAVARPEPERGPEGRSRRCAAPSARCPGSPASADLPGVRAPGDWPGKAETQKFADLLSVITILALLSAVVLISNTMSTLVAEQTHEIGIMRAVGARRRQVAVIYLQTTLLLGALGALVGIGLGILLSGLLARYFGSMFWAVDVGFGVDPVVLLVSVAGRPLRPAARGPACDPPGPACRPS